MLFFSSGNCNRIGSEADGNNAFGTRQGIKRTLDTEWLFGLVAWYTQIVRQQQARPST